MRFNTLSDWLHWQESLNPKEIELGLERVAAVLTHLQLSPDFSSPVITVAGTNGKGSTVAFIESILLAAGKTVGCYTSPHLFQYNERIRINGVAVSDELLCEAFAAVDQARNEIPLTYFEFGTLASLVLFSRFQLDVVVLEVGLGGRLDAVNVINPDVSVITSVDIDHIDWLGDDIESIGREKSGIMRKDKPCVVSIIKPPDSVLDEGKRIGARLLRLGQDYLFQGVDQNRWQLRGGTSYLADLPMPALKGGFQLQNAAAAIMAIDALPTLAVNAGEVVTGLENVKLTGRFQQLQEAPQVLVDVAHNSQSARVLAEFLAQENSPGNTFGVIAMLSDKAIDEVLQTVDPQIDHWFSAGLAVPRGLSAKNMAQAVRELKSDDKLTVSQRVEEACEAAMSAATENDRIIIFGSFYTVAEAINFFS